MLCIRYIIFVFLLCLAARADAQEGFTVHPMEGWRVYMEDSVDATTANQVLDIIRGQLHIIDSVLPSQWLPQLRETRIYVRSHADDSSHESARFHTNRKWLADHGYPDSFYRSIEIPDASTYIQTSKIIQSILLHEVCHAYWYCILPLDGAVDAFDAYYEAAQSGAYDSVAVVGGKIGLAYAMKSDPEYFAETSVAYFWHNTAFPFTREDLRRFDPHGDSVLTRCWYHPESYRFDSMYDSSQIMGFAVHISKRLAVPLRSNIIQNITSELQAFSRVQDTEALATLHGIPIYVDGRLPLIDTSYVIKYHSLKTIIHHRYHYPATDRGIEIAQPDEFLSRVREEPYLLAGLLAAAYGSRCDIDTGERHWLPVVYITASRKHLLDTLQALESLPKNVNGIVLLSFARLSMAYLGISEVYPHNARELESYDPKEFDLIADAWGKLR